MNTVDRIFSRMKELKLEQKELAFQVGVTPQAVSLWKRGQSKSYTKYIPQIARALATTSEWLLTGNDLQKDEPSILEDARPVRKGMIEVTQEGAQLLLAYEQADPALQELIKRALGVK